MFVAIGVYSLPTEDKEEEKKKKAVFFLREKKEMPYTVSTAHVQKEGQ